MMSFASSEPFSLDKEPDLFGQGYLDSSNDFLDQYLTFDSIEGEGSLYPGLPETTDVERSPEERQFASASSASREDEGGYRKIQGPQDDPWDFTQNAASPRVVAPDFIDIYSETIDRAPCSESDLLSLEGISLHSPDVTPSSPSLPSTPRPKSPPAAAETSPRKRYRFLDSVSKTLSIPKNLRKVTLGVEKTRSPTRKVTQTPEVHRLSPTRSPTRKATAGPDSHFSSPTRSPIRKSTSPAKMMRTSHYADHNLQWQERCVVVDASKFNFGFENPQGPLSPPPSAKVSDASDQSSTMLPANDNGNEPFSWDNPITRYDHSRPNPHTPIATPTPNMHAFAHTNMPAANGNGMVYPNTTQGQGHHPDSQWAQQSLPTMDGDYSAFIHSSYVPESEPSAVWWANASSAPLAHPSPAVYHRTPSQDMKSVVGQLQNELAYNATELSMSPANFQHGLNIQMPHTPVHQSFVVTGSPLHQPAEYFTIQPQMDHTSRHRYTHSQPNAHASPRIFSTPQVRKSRSRGDMPESPSPSTGMRTPYSVQKRRSSSVGRHQARRASEHHPATPKTPKTPKNASGFTDFVNFTPSDSGKILTGVAPSGSSKTKARREKEAADKRRRLSLAAMKAIQDAGGNIQEIDGYEGLVADGLLPSV